ncbi:hypothetical protein LINGRAHAP2_LOCUS23859 [Linum grandiflorum]
MIGVDLYPCQRFRSPASTPCKSGTPYNPTTATLPTKQVWLFPSPVISCFFCFLSIYQWQQRRSGVILDDGQSRHRKGDQLCYSRKHNPASDGGDD